MYRKTADKGVTDYRQWVETFRHLAEILKIKIE